MPTPRGRAVPANLGNHDGIGAKTSTSLVGLEARTRRCVPERPWNCHHGGMAGLARLARGDAVRYIAQPVFDGIIDTGEVGRVERVEDDWVFAWWPRSGLHSVPLANVVRVEE